MLKNRIEFDAKNEMNLSTTKNTTYYLNTPGPVNNKVNFLVKKINGSKRQSFQLDTLTVIIDHYLNSAGSVDMTPLIKIKAEPARRLLRLRILTMLKGLPLGVVFDNRKLISKHLIYDVAYNNENLTRDFRFAVDYGFYDVAKTLWKKYKKDFEKDPTLNYKLCKYLYSIENLKAAKGCLKKNKSPWYTLSEVYVHFLETGSVEGLQESYEKVKNELLAANDDITINFIIIFDYYFLGTIKAEEVERLKKSQNSIDYLQGFLLLSLDKKRKKLPADLAKQIYAKYKKEYGNKLLFKILDGSRKNDLLLKNLGKNAFLYRATL